MTKFYENDFRYEYRLGAIEPFAYVFYVSGESENYLMNKYHLESDRVIVYANLEKRIAIGNRRKKHSIWNIHPCAADDVDELYHILEPVMNLDMIWYDEYLAESDYYTPSERWVK